MKFLMVTHHGSGIGLLQRIAEEGNDVRLYITSKESKDEWEGLIEKVDKLPYEDDIIYLFDMCKNGDMADDLRSTGHYVIGASKFCDRVELDRNFGMVAMKKVGIPVPEVKEFNDFGAAIKFLKEQDDKYVFKPSNNLPPRLTYVPTDKEDLLVYLEYVQGVAKGKPVFILQEFVDGIAVSTEGWFNGSHFTRPFNHTIENKKYGNRNLGQSTGCQGNVVWACDEDRLTKHLQKIEPILKDKYVGPVDLNMMVSEDKEFGLEWTPRFGYDALPALIHIYEGEISKFLFELGHQTFDDTMELSDLYGAAIRATVPPYPYTPMKDEKLETPKGLPIRFDEDDFERYYLYGVKAGENDRLVAPDTPDGVVLCGLGSSADFTESILECEDALEHVHVPDLYYRTDLSDYLTKDFEKFCEVMEEKSNA